MVDRYLSTKFGINLICGFWENAFYGLRTTPDARTTAIALLTQSSRAKNYIQSVVELTWDPWSEKAVNEN